MFRKMQLARRRRSTEAISQSTSAQAVIDQATPAMMIKTAKPQLGAATHRLC